MLAKARCTSSLNSPMIKFLAIPFRNHAHRLRTRFDQRTGHNGAGLRSEDSGVRANLPGEG
jgi:hypothetical protein